VGVLRSLGVGLWAHPLVAPVTLAWWVLAALGYLLARRRARRRDEPPPGPAALGLACALGLFVAATLTPSVVGLGWTRGTGGQGWCLPQWPRTGFGLFAPNGERRLNVVLGVPMGFFAAVPWRRRPHCTVVALAACLALPEVVEVLQAMIPPLGRVCAVVDAVDNVSGVLVGAAAGLVAGALLAAVPGRRRTRRRPASGYWPDAGRR